MRRAALVFSLATGLAWPVQAADTVPARLDAARAAYARGDFGRTAVELEAAIVELHARLGKTLAEFLPAPLAGWQGEAPETLGLASAGGGLAVTRAYARDESTLNASLILDSPEVSAAAAQFTAQAAVAQPNFRRLKIGADDALLRWDASTRAGEITVVLGARVLLQIEGDNLTSSDILVDAARGWNIAAIRKATAG